MSLSPRVDCEGVQPYPTFHSLSLLSAVEAAEAVISASSAGYLMLCLLRHCELSLWNCSQNKLFLKSLLSWCLLTTAAQRN